MAAPEVRPLHLLDDGPHPGIQPRRLERRNVNLTASPIYGIGGLGLVALAVLLAVASPESLWVALAIVVTGMLLGGAWAFVQAHRPPPDHSSDALVTRR